MFKSGFVTIIGKPNSGKSTLINTFLKEKISIVTRRINTTRNEIRGIYNDDDSQIIFLDTPGFLKVTNKLDEKMKKIISHSLNEIDVLLYLIPFYEKIDQNYIDLFKIKELENVYKILVVTKLDLLKNKNEIPSLVEKFKSTKIFDTFIPVSSIKKQNIDILLKEIKLHLKDNVKFYETTQKSIEEEKFYISEIIREKLLIYLNDEIPHNIFVRTKEFVKKPNIYKIFCEVIVNRNGLKKIVIGEQGSKLKEIGTKSRIELEKYFKKKIFLELKVIVKEDWLNNEIILKDL